MSLTSFHFQGPVDNWPGYLATSQMRLAKFVTNFEMATKARQARPGIYCLIRQHCDHQGQYLENPNKDQAADDYILTYQDSAVALQPEGHMSLNEIYVSNDRAHNANSVAFDRAFLRRSRIHLPNSDPHVFSAPIGNPGFDEFDLLVPLAEDTIEYGGVWDYRTYWPARRGKDWLNDPEVQYYLHMRWNQIDQYLVERGLRVRWCFGEAGPIAYAGDDPYNLLPGVTNGWRHPDVYGGDVDRLLEDLSDFDGILRQTQAYREGRILGYCMFTSNLHDWPWFRIDGEAMRRIAVYTAESPPPPEPPPPPPAEYWRVRPDIDFLNLRTVPRAINPTTDIGDLHPGAGPLEILEWDDTWAKVAGWVHGGYLVLADPGMIVLDITDTLTKHPTKHYGTRALGAITTHVVHHSATGPTCTPEQIARYHVYGLDWPGIGYHFVITPDGTIYQTNGVTTTSYHVAGNNGYTIGTCLVGNFTQGPPTGAQICALEFLQHQWLPGLLGRTLALKGHKEMPGAQTACPGDKWDWHL
jgi:hypothetical protein